MKITKAKITKLIEQKEGIAKLVLQDMFDKSDYTGQAQEEFAESFTVSFQELLTYGTTNGIISKMIYYTDTHAFFDEHYNEIEESRKEYEKSTGEAVKIKGDLKDYLARFGYETVAYKLAAELGIE